MLIEKNGYLGGVATAGRVAPFMTCYDAQGEKQIIGGIFRETVEKLLACGVSPVNRKPAEGAFSGKKVVLTGSLSRYTRSEAAALIEKNGGTVQSSVGKNTDLVIAGENAGGKLEKARKLSIKIISEEQFILLLNA